MAPALGPTTALAMCAAAFVGWRAPSQPAQTAEPEVEEFASMDKLGDGEMHTVLSGINVSSDLCEDAMLPLHAWQHWNSTLSSTNMHVLGLPDDSLDMAMTYECESETETMIFQNISIPVDHDKSQSMQQTNVRPVFLGDDFVDSFVSGNQGSFALWNDTGFDLEPCPQLATCPIPIANESEPCQSTVWSAESRNGFDDRGLGTSNELAVMETETVSEVFFLHAEDEMEIVLPSVSVSFKDDITAVSTAQVEQEALNNWQPAGRDESSNFQSMLEEFVEFARLSWLTCLTQGRKMVSQNMLDASSQALQQWGHACLAMCRTVLGEDLFIRVSEVVVQWWQVALMCFASLCDVVLFGFLGRSLLGRVRSFCCCGRRAGPTAAEFGVAHTKKIDPCEKQDLLSDEPEEFTRLSSGTPQVPAPMFDDVRCDVASGGGNIESAIKGQRSPFNSAIQFRSIPTPARRVVAGHVGFASSQHVAANSVPAS